MTDPHVPEAERRRLEEAARKANEARAADAKTRTAAEEAAKADRAHQAAAVAAGERQLGKPASQATTPAELTRAGDREAARLTAGLTQSANSPQHEEPKVRVRGLIDEAWHTGTAINQFTDGRICKGDEADVSKTDADKLIAAGHVELASDPRRPRNA